MKRKLLRFKKNKKTGCLECISHKCDMHGRPKINVNGKPITVSRLIWQELNGSIHEKLCVLHKCDNPKCCNIEHLFVGTQADNLRDMAAKGRNHKTALLKLSSEDIKEIFCSSDFYKNISKKYGIPYWCIGNIRMRLSGKQFTCGLVRGVRA